MKSLIECVKDAEKINDPSDKKVDMEKFEMKNNKKKSKLPKECKAYSYDVVYVDKKDNPNVTTKENIIVKADTAFLAFKKLIEYLEKSESCTAIMDIKNNGKVNYIE